MRFKLYLSLLLISTFVTFTSAQAGRHGRDQEPGHVTYVRALNNFSERCGDVKESVLSPQAQSIYAMAGAVLVSYPSGSGTFEEYFLRFSGASLLVAISTQVDKNPRLYQARSWSKSGSLHPWSSPCQQINVALGLSALSTFARVCLPLVVGEPFPYVVQCICAGSAALNLSAMIALQARAAFSRR